MSAPLLDVENLCFTYPGRSAATLTNVTFQIQPASWTVIAGRTGSGKSTLLRALAGLIPRHTEGRFTGSVRYQGTDLGDLAPAELAARIGLVLQSPDDQICATRVSAEVAFGLENLRTDPRQIGSQVAQALEQMELTPCAQQPTDELSGGQKQRLVLAAVLAMQPRLLVLDEPLSQLDPQAAADVLARLDSLRRQGIAIIMVEHRLDELLNRADRVLVIDSGSLLGEFAAGHRRLGTSPGGSPLTADAANASGTSGASAFSPGNETSLAADGEIAPDAPLEVDLAEAFDRAGLALPELAQVARSQGLPLSNSVEALSTLLAIRAKPEGPLIKTGEDHGPDTQEPATSASAQPEARKATPGSATPAPALLVAEHLGFRFPRTDAPLWQKISFTLSGNECVALVGPNGCGKSTLLAVLAGLLQPTHGQLHLTRAAGQSEESRTGPTNSTRVTRCGLVLQRSDLMLFCPTVREELAFGPAQLGFVSEGARQPEAQTIGGWTRRAKQANPRDSSMQPDEVAAPRIGKPKPDDLLGQSLDTPPSDSAAQAVQDVARVFDLEGHLDDPPLALSQGQRLRTAVAATMVTRPDVLLLDEPTTGQDPQQVDRVMRHLTRPEGAGPHPAALLFATHDLRAVARYAQRVLVLAEGRLLADVTPAQLLDDDHLLARARLRRTPLERLCRRLGLRGMSVEEVIQELDP